MPSNRQKLLLNLCFLGLPFLITFIPYNKFIIIIIIIVSCHIFSCWCVTNQSETNCKEKGSPHAASWHISHQTKWSGTSFSCHGSTLTASWHISSVLKRSGRRKNTAGLSHIALLHIFYVMMWSGTLSSVYTSLPTASLHIFSVLIWSGKNAKERGCIPTASSHISCVLRWPGISLIQRGTFADRDIFIHTLRSRKGSNFMSRTQITINVSLITLIFVCVGCLEEQLKINCKYNTKKRWFTTKLS